MKRRFLAATLGAMLAWSATASAQTLESAQIRGIVYDETKGNFPVKVMNTTYLRTHLRNQPKTIEPAQVQRIIEALDEKCRTLEF